MGIIIILVSLVLAVAVKWLKIEITQWHKEWFKILFSNAFMLGLLLLAFAKDKFEDDISALARTKALVWTFIWVVFYVIIMPLMDLLFNDPPVELIAREVVTTMLIIYLISYYSQGKLSRRMFGIK